MEVVAAMTFESLTKDLAASLDAHFHVDAAWGFGLALTSTALHGIERADTVTVDGHKLSLGRDKFGFSLAGRFL